MKKLAVVHCPYCGKRALLVDSAEVYRRSYGMIWICRGCDAYTGVHQSSAAFKPLGTLANAELRKLRSQVHTLLDPLWQKGRFTRNACYIWLASKLGIPGAQCHVAMFDDGRCKEAIRILEEQFKK